MFQAPAESSEGFKRFAYFIAAAVPGVPPLRGACPEWNRRVPVVQIVNQRRSNSAIRELPQRMLWVFEGLHGGVEKAHGTDGLRESTAAQRVKFCQQFYTCSSPTCWVNLFLFQCPSAGAGLFLMLFGACILRRSSYEN